ncbi:LysR family transcriptional regulator [Hoeflea prorocentri]|uniref:LysR family transcriptional regulator n=1 Tax=Hoeflea prorocentri TaxID=1922333 RepID=A0A9X3ZFM2_9HYPH|nr:LysR family transcriptional regulator [Hoeflea prorocentri]MCY6379363.1 LysR family transcriptional regulator [Hoeflea prorocentri]MDA5397164.1 LysR family transcriptional regulator [Hoeflea prorocentri]
MNWLRVFEAAARHESFAKASVELAVSPAAVSQQILALETHLGEALFIRKGNRIELNNAGRSLLPTVERSLSNIEAKLTSLFHTKSHQHVILESSQLLTMSWLPQKIAKFEAQNENIRISVRSDDFVKPDGEDVADITITFGRKSEFSANAKPLIPVNYVVVGAPEVVGSIFEIEDILKYRLLDVASHSIGWQHILTELPIHAEVSDVDLMPVDNTPIAFSMAREGLGLAISLGDVCEPLAESLGLATIPIVRPIRSREQYYMDVNKPSTASRGALLLEKWLLKNA